MLVSLRFLGQALKNILTKDNASLKHTTFPSFGKGTLKRAFVIAFTVLFAAPAQAQMVKSMSVDTELKRLTHVCVKYAEVGRTGMPDLSKYGYKVNKLGMVGGNRIAFVAVNTKKLDTKSLKKGTGLYASIRWAKPFGHQCEITVTLKLDNDLKYARNLEAKVAKNLKSLGYSKKAMKDKRGRPYDAYVKGANTMTIVSTVGYGKGKKGINSVNFNIQNKNDTARKN
jgi:hypothetical protein